jgi:hypothetical protein
VGENQTLKFLFVVPAKAGTTRGFDLVFLLQPPSIPQNKRRSPPGWRRASRSAVGRHLDCACGSRTHAPDQRNTTPLRMRQTSGTP